MTRHILTTVDSVDLASRSWRQEEPSVAVVLVHGFTASADDPNVVTLAEALHDTGVEVVTYDTRGHGTSSGSSTLGDLERHDVAAAVDAARTRADSVIVVGASMGAIAALRYASIDHDLAGTVIVSCPADWRLPRNVQGLAAAAMTRTGFGRAAARRFLKVRIASEWQSPEPPVDLAARVRAPSRSCTVTSTRSSRYGTRTNCARTFTAPCRLRVVADMGHAFQPAAVAEIVDAVAWILDPAPQPA